MPLASGQEDSGRACLVIVGVALLALDADVDRFCYRLVSATGLARSLTRQPLSGDRHLRERRTEEVIPILARAGPPLVQVVGAGRQPGWQGQTCPPVLDASVRSVATFAPKGGVFQGFRAIVPWAVGAAAWFIQDTSISQQCPFNNGGVAMCGLIRRARDANARGAR